ncbi:MAG: hypothetical protein LBC86_10200 [Oscillospiraceae bacterium]|jgi:hypothetical protein|nr:hypothetical protein [Oscillospiraceae bacterium]
MIYEFNLKNPAFDRVVFLLTVDKKKMSERVIIGEAGEVRLRLERNIGDFFYDEVRPIGSLLFNFETNPERDWNVNLMQIYEKGFKIRLSVKSVPKALNQCINFLRGKYENGEPSAMFAAIRIWENYLRCYNINHGADIFKDRSAMLCKPFHALSEYKAWELEAVNALQTALHAEESQVELWYPVSKRPFECVVTYSSFLTIIFYYLNKIEEWGLVFQECKVCGSYFLTKSRHFELCGDECRKAQAIEARRQFDERNKDEKVEAIYENHYQYWYNRLRRLKKSNAAEADILAFTNIFNKFRKEAVKRKNEVKSGKMKLSAFTSWLAEQQNIVDGVVKRGGEKWK